ncbi:MAG: chloride channel protein [Lactobacillus sp.]|jgi:H+/Cl- antiporter ClcA|nr:chloride channel protein [Lactobacillus sp.]
MKETSHNHALFCSTLVIAVLAGVGAVILSLLLTFTEHVFLAFEETAAHPYAGLITGTHRLLSLTIGGIIAAVVWWWMRRTLKPTVGLATAVDGQRMPVVTTIVHVVTQIFYVGVGGSVGRELAPRELAGMLAQQWNAWLTKHAHWQLSVDDQRLLIAAAAGAGFAGVYIAPLTGTMFAVEVLYKQVSKRSVIVSLSMSAIATLIGSLLKGFKPYYLVGPQNFGVRAIPLVIVVGLLCGAAGAGFRKAFKWANQHQTRGNGLLWQLPLVAFGTGLIAMTYPQIMGNGRALAQTAIGAKTIDLLPLLVLVAIFKAVMTVLTLRAGASGGTLTPSIAIGASMGLMVAMLVTPLSAGVPFWQAGVIGAGAFLAVSQQAPFMAMFMLFEVSHLNYSALLPLGIGICCAMVVGNLVLEKRALG